MASLKTAGLAVRHSQASPTPPSAVQGHGPQHRRAVTTSSCPTSPPAQVRSSIEPLIWPPKRRSGTRMPGNAPAVCRRRGSCGATSPSMTVCGTPRSGSPTSRPSSRLRQCLSVGGLIKHTSIAGRCGWTGFGVEPQPGDWDDGHHAARSIARRAARRVRPGGSTDETLQPSISPRRCQFHRSAVVPQGRRLLVGPLGRAPHHRGWPATPATPTSSASIRRCDVRAHGRAEGWPATSGSNPGRPPIPDLPSA